MNLSKWFDPDRRLLSKDKFQHFFGGWAVCALLTLILPVWEAVAWTTVIGFVYEGGQADVAYSQKLLGKPGYGIGLIDLVADVLGALSWIGIRALFLG